MRSYPVESPLDADAAGSFKGWIRLYFSRLDFRAELIPTIPEARKHEAESGPLLPSNMNS